MLNLLVGALTALAPGAPVPSRDAFPSDPQKAIEKVDKQNAGLKDKSGKVILEKRKKLAAHLKNKQAAMIKQGKAKEAEALGDLVTLVESSEATDLLGPAAKMLAKGRVSGKYKKLLRMLHLPNDKKQYTDFTDFGHYKGTTHAGFTMLPPGYWVYVYPYWFIWGEGPAVKE
jgi:hypothetical protein